MAAEDGQIGQAAYSSSKGGVVGMTLPVARDLAVVGIRVNTILPGPHRHADLRQPARAPRRSRSKLAEDVLFPHRLGYASTSSPRWRSSCSANSYMNAESIRIDAGIRMQPK